MSTFGFLTSWMGTKTREAGGMQSLNLVALKDTKEAKNRSSSDENDKKRPRRFSEERVLSKANALSFFQDAAFGEEDEAESSKSRKSSRLDKENDEQNTDQSASPSPSKSAKKRKNRRIDLRNKELVKQKRRLRIRN